MEKPERIFREMDSQARWGITEKERFFLLAILGKKSRILPRNMVCKCDEANGSVIFSGHFGKNEKGGIGLKLFLLFPKLSGGKDCKCSICCPMHENDLFVCRILLLQLARGLQYETSNTRPQQTISGPNLP